MSRYKIVPASSGDPTLVFCAGRDVKLHSGYDPMKEAERSAGSFIRGRATMIVVSGLALGYHIAALKKRFPDASIVAVEHDREVAELARMHAPGNIEDVPVILGRDGTGAVFEGIDIKKFYGIAHYIHRPSYRLYSGFYDEIIADMKHQISSRISDLLTRIEFETNWVQNIFRNIPALFRSARAGGLFGSFAGYPGIIVSAGPSLKKNVAFIREIQDRALVVCVDTALKVMERHGVRPHVIMTLDSQKHSVRHFLGTRDHTPLLMADIVSCPAVLRSWQGPRAMSTTSKYYTGSDGRSMRETTPVMDWIEKYIEPMGDIQSGGSVATSAFDLLLNLGCDPIVLVGQDLAYTGREIHSTGTHHNDDWIPQITRFLNLDTINQRIIRKRKVVYPEAYGGSGTVISDFVLDLYRGWFADSAGKVGVRVINATEGGARIANTLEKPLAAVFRNREKPGKSPREIIEAHWESRSVDRGESLREAIREACGSIREIMELAGNSGGNRVLEIIEEKGLTELFNPYLRKTDIFVSRHEPGPEESMKIYSRDILGASRKLLPLLETCLKELMKL